MPRPPRLLLSQSYYHIMTRGNNKNVVFRNEDDYLYFLSLMKKYKSYHSFYLYHYCLMPTHVHILIKTKNAVEFATYMKRINLAYFHHYRQKYGWVGHFWQDRYKSQPVGKDEYFIQCGKYIELNPVRKGIVKKPEDYQYSSYRFYVLSEKNDLITADLFYNDLGKSVQERQKKYHELIVSESIAQNYKHNIWGNSEQRYSERQKISRKFNKKFSNI